MAANIYVNEIELEPEECILHKGAKVNAICESCDEPVCLRCLLGSHNGHPIVDIQEARERVREDLLGHRRALRKEIKKMEANLRDYTEKEAENDRECGLALNKIRKRGKTLQTQLTKLLQDLENEVKDRQEQNQSLISEHKDPLESQLKTATSKLNEIDIGINSDNMYSTIHLKQELAKRSGPQQNGHAEVSLQIPKFEYRQTTPEDVCELLGHVVMCDDKAGEDAEDHEYDYVEPIQQQKPKPSTKKKPSKKYAREPVPQLPPPNKKDDKYCEYIGTSSIMGFNNIRKTKLSDTQINSICPLTKNQAWTTDDSGKCLKLVSEKGHTIRTVTANTKKSDIALTSDGAVLMTCPDKCCIKKYSQDGTIRIFINTPDYFPHGICIHFLTEEIFVGLIDADTYDVKSDSNRFIQRYSRKGEPLQQINIQKTSTLSLPFTKKSPVVTIPHKVKVNQNTSEVGLVNWLRGGQGQVLVFTPEGKIKFTYPEDAKTPFEATDMVFTASNHIIVCDGVTRALHMLCPNGRFIKVLHTFDHVPASLAYFGDGLLWIGNKEGEIIVSSFKE